ncbi:homocysteine S-methyltransferase family protein [Trujillonella endophytica]|uniref:Homocysteine S-methyltransferase n=1 Tax=Trujillonella endophytica TaxID=673521 RepID=A0A1H8Q274_9ACTN|nr:homocysteine S-methyltransferase family protein [Trujillella endophytica]SEO47863.1 homocysteine S-methyltransferase [Trujillella endophytica]
MTSAPRLPLLDDRPFLTDGGLETDLIFLQGVDLPEFAAFPLLETADGTARLRDYYEGYLAIAREHDTGFVLETPTWRASSGWGERLGYDAAGLDRVNRLAVALLAGLRDREAGRDLPALLSGNIGPQADAYAPDTMLTAERAQAYHAPQIDTFADAGVDLVTALTITYVEEAVGIVRAAVAAGVPAVVSFTVETDGRLPSGRALGEAVTALDDATDGAAAHLMVNCAHPSHFAGALEPGAAWTGRIRGIRANASTRSHAELDEAETLDDGDPADLGRRYGELSLLLPRLAVAGGCCGTDTRHVEAIAREWPAVARL